MMRLMFAGMNDQQAPSMPRQTWLGPVQRLSRKAQRSSGGTSFQNT